MAYVSSALWGYDGITGNYAPQPRKHLPAPERAYPAFHPRNKIFAGSVSDLGTRQALILKCIILLMNPGYPNAI